MRHRAQAATKDAIAAQPGRGQLIAISAPQVEMRPWPRADEPSIQMFGRVPGFGEGLEHRLTDLVVLRADAGADGGEHIGRIGPEVPLHSGDGCRRYLRAGAAPPGVDRGSSAVHRVDDQDGNAVGHHHCQHQSWLV